MASRWQKKKNPTTSTQWTELPAPKSQSLQFNPVLINESIFLFTDYDEGEEGLIEYHCGLNTFVQIVKYPPTFRPISQSVSGLGTNQYDIVMVDGVNGKLSILNTVTEGTDAMAYTNTVAIPVLGRNTSSLVIRGNVHIIGGKENLEDQYLIYSIGTGQVMVLRDQSISQRMTSISFTKRDDDSEFYKFGGFDWEKKEFVDTFYVGKLQNDDAEQPIIWIEYPRYKLRKPLHSCGVIQYNSYIITFGGWTTDGEEIDDIYILNTRSNTGWIKSGIRCPVKGQYVAVLDHQQRVHLFTRWNDPTKHYCIPLKALLFDQGQNVPSSLKRARVSFKDSQRIRQLQEKEKESVNLKDENVILKAMNESLNDEMERMFKENEIWKKTVLLWKKTNQDLTQRLHEFERCNTVMQRDNEELTGELKQHATMVQKLESEKKRLTETMHLLNSSFAERQDALNAVNQEKKQLDAELSGMKKNEVMHRSVLKGLMRENKRLKKEKKVAQKTIDELKDKVKDLELNALNPSEFTQWDWKQIHLWIMGLETGRFKKYDTLLQTALSRGNLYGEDLLEVNPLVMKYWGIQEKEDREALNDQIQKLMTEGS